jgi:N-acetylglucosaminyldiphosphoundecaprenol N-acetyl-beta-D-mannosaminyltransferase
MSLMTANILGTRINALGWEQVISRVLYWASAPGTEASRTVCVCNVHSLVTARRDPAFARALRDADLRTPDGAPIAWIMRQQGWPEQPRISGPELMWLLMQEAERLGLPIFLLGGMIDTLKKLRARLRASFPGLRIAGQCSPAFRNLDDHDYRHIRRMIEISGARLVFVGLGCPKQELWMAHERGKLNAVMIGVGAAFDYHAGTLRRAPLAWQSAGLEWLYRLAMEPVRLLRRYLVTNALFLLWLPGQLWRRGAR